MPPVQPSPVLFRPRSRPPVGPLRPYGFPANAAPVPTQIPICWLSPPVMLRLEQPFTTAAITRTGGGTYRDKSDANRSEYGEFEYAAELDTATAADPSNLAHWTITYRSTPRMRIQQLAINLLYRTDTEKVTLLRIPRWSRIQLTGVPPEFPEGASSVVVAGMKHQMGLAGRMLFITTAPVVGVTAGVPGPWFRYGASNWGGSDIIPF